MTAPILSLEATAIDSRSRELKNQVFVCLAVIANTLGNFLLSLGMHAVQLKPSASPLGYLRIFANPWIDASVVLLTIWFASQLSLLSWADLSYVLPVTAASYVLTTVLGKIFLHEFISLARWSGICVISAGVMLVVGTAPRAKLSAREILP
jgi:drug/metabolite transporter (DMT)-like permease